MPNFVHGKNVRVAFINNSASATVVNGYGPLAITAVATSSPSAGYTTYTTVAPHGLYVGGTVTVINMLPTAYNASGATITGVASPTSFTIANSATAAITQLGGVSGLVGYTGYNPFVANQYVTVAGNTNSSLNLTGTVAGANNIGFSLSTTATVATGTAATGTGGTGTSVATGYDLSQFFNDAGLSFTAEATESTTFQTGGVKSYIKGLKDGTITLSGYYDGTQQGVDAIMTEAINNNGDDAVIVFPFGGNTDNERCWLSQGIETKYELKSPVAGIVTIDTEIQADGGVAYGTGKSFSITGTGASASTVALNNQQASNNGGLLLVSVTALSAGATLSLYFQSSSDGVTWTSGASSQTPIGNTISAVGAEIYPISGSIYQYTRLYWTLNSGASATIFYGFARY